MELLRWLQGETDRKILLVGGEAEGERLPRIVRALDAERVRVVSRSPLVEVAGLLARCELFVGHDSGITHLAAAVGCRAVALWGPSKRKIWAPVNEQVRVVEAEGGNIDGLPTATVLEAVRGVLGAFTTEEQRSKNVLGSNDAKPL